jgi:hypothetical protein
VLRDYIARECAQKVYVHSVRVHRECVHRECVCIDVLSRGGGCDEVLIRKHIYVFTKAIYMFIYIHTYTYINATRERGVGGE